MVSNNGFPAKDVGPPLNAERSHPLLIPDESLVFSDLFTSESSGFMPSHSIKSYTDFDGILPGLFLFQSSKLYGILREGAHRVGHLSITVTRNIKSTSGYP